MIIFALWVWTNLSTIALPSKSFIARRVRKYTPKPNFITIHYLYFVILCIVSSVLIYASSTTKKVTYIDCLLLSVAAITSAGLNPVNLGELNTFQQIVIFFMILLGSSVLISSYVLIARKRSFEAKFTQVLEGQSRRTIVPTDSTLEQGDGCIAINVPDNGWLAKLFLVNL
jgi:Trk-type K+ transport system membrane component